MGTKSTSGKPTTRRYSPEEKARAVRLVRQLRKELGTTHGTVQRVADQIGQIKNGIKVRLRGECRMDPFLGELSIGVRDMQKMPKV